MLIAVFVAALSLTSPALAGPRPSLTPSAAAKEDALFKRLAHDTGLGRTQAVRHIDTQVMSTIEGAREVPLTAEEAERKINAGELSAEDLVHRPDGTLAYRQVMVMEMRRGLHVHKLPMSRLQTEYSFTDASGAPVAPGAP